MVVATDSRDHGCAVGYGRSRHQGAGLSEGSVSNQVGQDFLLAAGLPCPVFLAVGRHCPTPPDGIHGSPGKGNTKSSIPSLSNSTKAEIRRMGRTGLRREKASGDAREKVCLQQSRSPSGDKDQSVG